MDIWFLHHAAVSPPWLEMNILNFLSTQAPSCCIFATHEQKQILTLEALSYMSKRKKESRVLKTYLLRSHVLVLRLQHSLFLTHAVRVASLCSGNPWTREPRPSFVWCANRCVGWAVSVSSFFVCIALCLMTEVLISPMAPSSVSDFLLAAAAGCRQLRRSYALVIHPVLRHTHA